MIHIRNKKASWLHAELFFVFCGMLCPHRNHMVSMWKPCSVHMETMWCPHLKQSGVHLETRYCSQGNHMISTWKPCGVHLNSTWCPHGNHAVST